MRIPAKRNQRTFYDLFLGCLIKDGDKIVAKKILDQALFLVSLKFKCPPALILLYIENRLSSLVELRTVSIRKGTIQVPFTVGYNRQRFLIIKNILSTVKKDKTRRSFTLKLSEEIVNVLLNRGKTISNRNEQIAQVAKFRSNAFKR